MKRIKQKDKSTISVGDMYYIESHTTKSKVVAICDDQEKGVKLIISRYWSRTKARYYYLTYPIDLFIYNAYLWSECTRSWANKVCDSFGINHLF